MTEITPGRSAQRSLHVGEEHSAVQWGSGGLCVFASPCMIALMEGAAVDAVDHLLPSGRQTVGTHVDVAHLAATPLGGRVTATARLTAVDGRRLFFAVEAHDEQGCIGRGTHERFVVDLERFMAKAAARRDA